MTYEKYMSLREQMGKEPIESEIPVQGEDLPMVAQIAINTFNMMNDRISADIGYLGKDYSILDTLLSDVDQKSLCVEVILWLDKKHIAKSQSIMEKEREKLKLKGKHGK
jgi:hypothetical protein